jgi:tRNA(Ile)-lysidine synthase
MTLTERVQDALAPWVPRNSRVLLAVSGGADSVALAHLIKTLPYDPVIAHVDHQLRSGSARDAQFVGRLASQWGMPFRLKKTNVARFARRHGLGLEDAGRQLRYAALTDFANKSRCSFILTAHNANDQAETVLMNFLRGAGPAGLSGIPPVRNITGKVRLIRPLLSVTRQEIRRYLQTHRLSYREDPSNRSLRFTRNRIRHQLLPLLDKQFPGLKERLVGVAEVFREEQSLWTPQVNKELRKTVRKNNKNITVDLTRLLGYHRALGRRILRHLLTGISFQDTERIFHLALSTNGHLPIQLAGGLQVQRKGNKLIFPKRTA